MSTNLEDILRKMGWNDGFQIPVANKENQELEAKVAKLMLKKAKSTVAYENANARYDALEKHLKYVNRESEENQSLLVMHKQQLESEEHRYLVLKSEKSRFQQETRQITKALQDSSERSEMKKKDLSNGLSKLEKLKSEMSWDAEALKAWEESLKKRDEDNELLKKFSKEDEHKANELEAKRKKLQTEFKNRKKSVATMVTDIINYEQMLERTAKVFKQQRTEREALVRQWQESVKNLRQRDDAIEKANLEISSTQDLLSKKKELLDEQNQFLQNEIDNNKEIEIQIEEGNLINSKIRRELNDLIQLVLTLSNEASTLNRTITGTANYLEKERITGRNLDKSLVYKEYQIDELERTLSNLEQKLENVKDTSVTSAERTKQLEQLIELEQRQVNILSQDIERIQGILFRSQQVLRELKDAAKINDLETANFENHTNLLRRQAKNVYNEWQKQKEIIYDLDYRIDQMESKLAKLEGVSVEEEPEEHNKRLKELEEIFTEHSEVKNLLQGQINRIQEEMRRITSAMSLDNSQMQILDSKLKEQILLFEGGRKQCQTAKLKVQQKQVEENVIKLKVNQFENAMKREDSNIYSLQKFRLELDNAMKERQIEINTNKEILLVKRRNLSEEKGRLKCDIMNRHIRIEQWQKKYHIAIMSLGKGDDGQPLSVTHFKIKNAQEKYMLQQEGDDLDTKIRAAEKEIIAMENTLKVVNMTNRSYKQSLSSVEEEADEYREMKQLENEIRDENLALRKLKRELDNKKDANRELVKQNKELQEETMKIGDNFKLNQSDYFDILRHENDKQIKIERTDKQIKSLSKKLSGHNIKRYDQDLEIRFLQDANKNILHKLREMTVRYQEMTPLIIRYTTEYNIQLPASRSLNSSNTSLDTALSLPSGITNINNIIVQFDPQPTNNKKTTTPHFTQTK